MPRVLAVPTGGTDMLALTQSPHATFALRIEVDADIGGGACPGNLRR